MSKSNLHTFFAECFFSVLTASDLEKSAGGRGDPKVARAGVENHVEALARSPDFDGAVILGLKRKIFAARLKSWDRKASICRPSNA